MYIYMCIYIYICIYVYIYMCIYIYICICVWAIKILGNLMVFFATKPLFIKIMHLLVILSNLRNVE